MTSRFAWVLALIVLLSGCVSTAQQHFQQGERLKKDGQLAGAKREFEKAKNAEPQNPTYAQALSSVDQEIASEVSRISGEARKKEKASDWAAASSLWSRAFELEPDNLDFKARKLLSRAKSSNLGPKAWYEEMQKISKQLPGNSIVDRSLDSAKTKAYEYYIGLASDLLDSGDGAAAHDQFEAARVIDPTMPGVDPGRLDLAAAYDLAAQGDAQMDVGAYVGAYELYRKAYERRPQPVFKKKLAAAKKKAAHILAKLELARKKARSGKWRAALSAYEAVLAMKGAPPEVEAEAKDARVEVSRLAAYEAQRLASRGKTRKAIGKAREAVSLGGFDAGTAEAINSGLSAVADGRPGEAKGLFDSAQVPAEHPLTPALSALATKEAKRKLAAASRMAKKDSAGAMKILNDLTPFQDELPKIADLKRSLRGASFASLLEGAVAAARSGDRNESSASLKDALDASKAPDDMRKPAEKAIAALASGKDLEAQAAFQDALRSAPRSKLARAGIDASKALRQIAERDALTRIESGRGDVRSAVEILAQSFEKEPGNARVRAASRALTARAKAEGKALDDKALAELLDQAARLTEMPKPARSSFGLGLKSLGGGQHDAAQKAFDQAKARAPRLEIAAIGASLSGARQSSALRADMKSAGKGSAASASAAAVVLKKNPKDADAKAAVDELMAKAETAGRAGDDREAGRLLGLVVVATEPAPGVKKHLVDGNTALAAGKMVDAERHYNDALYIEAEQPVAKLGLDLAKQARVEGLNKAVADAKSGGDTAMAAAALERTLKLDANSAEARKAFAELLEAAKVKGREGKDREAARLLDAANAASKPETAKKKIASANKLLAEGRHESAEKAYTKILAGAESRVASTGLEIVQARRSQDLLGQAEELEKGTNLERGAQAVKALRAKDPNNAAADRAIDASLSRAKSAAAGGDTKAAAKELEAVRVAMGGDGMTKNAIAMIGDKRFREAEKSFRGKEDVLSKAALSIAQTAQVADLSKLLARADAAAKNGDLKMAAVSLSSALVQSAPKPDLKTLLTTAIEHVEKGNFAEAERSFSTAVEAEPGSQVAKAGTALSRRGRTQDEKRAMKAIKAGRDIEASARILAAGRIVEAKSRNAEKAYGVLISRAKKAAKKGKDLEIAEALRGALVLDPASEDVEENVRAALASLGEGKLKESADALEAVTSGRVAPVARGLVNDRRLSTLRRDIKAAQKSKDTGRAAELVGELLVIAPKDRNALRLQKKLASQMGKSRMKGAERYEKSGQVGAAYFLYQQAAKTDPRAKGQMSSLASELNKRKDLIVLVDTVERSGLGTHLCRGFETTLREALMSTLSEKTSLGMYVLSKSWSEAVANKAEDAPEVGGVLTLKIASCDNGSSYGKVKVSWALEVPANGKVVTKGDAADELPRTLIPRDEQDRQGRATSSHLAKRTAKKIVGDIESVRSQIETWLLTLAEHGVAEKKPELAADAYSRWLIANPSAKDARARAVESYLQKELR